MSHQWASLLFPELPAKADMISFIWALNEKARLSFSLLKVKRNTIILSLKTIKLTVQKHMLLRKTATKNFGGFFKNIVIMTLQAAKVQNNSLPAFLELQDHLKTIKLLKIFLSWKVFRLIMSTLILMN